MILPIIEVPNTKLRRRSKEIKKIDRSVLKLAFDMIETKRANFGMGIAAPQIGRLLKLIVIENPKNINSGDNPEIPLTVLVNPQIVESSEEKTTMEESCLSLPGIAAMVPRASKIKIKGQKIEIPNDGQCKIKKIHLSTDGLFARILQHEIDHLDGILFSDRTEDPKTISKIALPYKIVFFGTPEFSVPILEGLIKNGWGISVVITEPDKPAGRKKILNPTPIKKVAQKYGLVFYQPQKIKDLLPQFKALKPDLIIVAAYAQILPREILDIPKYGSLCMHPSLLPKYRGPSPIQSAILNGEKETGVTIFKMDEKIDHGSIIATEKQIIEPSDNYQTLSKRIAVKGIKLLLDTLSPFLEGKIKAISQNDKKASYTKMIKKEDGYIESSKFKSIDLKILQEIEKKIRAFYPWPKVWTTVDGKRVIIYKAHLEHNQLILDTVQVEGKKPMPYAEYLKGNPKIA